MKLQNEQLLRKEINYFSKSRNEKLEFSGKYFCLFWSLKGTLG